MLDILTRKEMVYLLVYKCPTFFIPLNQKTNHQFLWYCYICHYYFADYYPSISNQLNKNINSFVLLYNQSEANMLFYQDNYLLYSYQMFDWHVGLFY